MICPHCSNDIPDVAMAKHLAAKGGAKSKRKITPEQQAAMQAARASKRKSLEGIPHPSPGHTCPI